MPVTEGNGTGSRPHVVVIGAGFGGIATARELAGDDVDVTVVDRNNYQTFQPLLYQVATAGLDSADVAHAVRAMFQRQPNVGFRRAAVTGVDWDTRTVLVDDGAPLPFDFLVLALGASTNYFGIEGAADHGFPLYVLPDAITLRNHILDQFEQVDADRSLLEQGALTFVVVGGGPTGVEMAGAIVELVEMALAKDFRGLDPERQVRIVLVEMLDHVLGPFAPGSRRHAHESLEARGVELRLGVAVERVEPDRVVLDSGEEIPSRTLIWAAGVQANPLAGELGLGQGKAGRIVVNPDLTVPGDPRVLVVGDLAAIPAGDGVLPQLAPVAMQSGRHAARQIRRLLAGQGTTRFKYRNRGTMATIGRRAAVAELPLGIRLRGTVAWVAWLVLHLAMLIGPRNKLSVLVNWSWNYLTYDRNQRLIIESPADPVPPGEHGPDATSPAGGEDPDPGGVEEGPDAGGRQPTVLGDDVIAD